MTAATAPPSTGVSPHRTTLAHMPGLDGLRGVAVAGVLAFHAGHLVGGYLGVDLFFVLSGFLITSLLLREAGEQGRVDLAAFWRRRARRLLPAVAGMLLGVAAYAWVLAGAAELERIRGDGLATVAYVANWHNIVAATDYWDLFTAPSPLQHMWSVAIEEQFYLVWPLVVVGLLRWRGVGRLASSVLVAAGVLSLGSLRLMVALHDPGDRSRVYFGTDTRASAILLGVGLAAWLVVRGPARSALGRWATQAAGIAGAGVLAFAWAQVDGRSEWLYHGGLFALGLAAVAVIAAIATSGSGPLARLLGLAPLRWLGLVSYGVYLWHWPVYLVLDQGRTGLDGWRLLVLRVGATLVVATVSYLAVEQPIRRGRLSGAPVAQRLAIPVGTVAVVAALVLTTGGRAPEHHVEALVWPDTPEDAVARIEAAPRQAERVMVVGNSVGLFLGGGFSQIEADPPIVSSNRSLLGCTFPTPVDVRLANGERFPQGVVDCTKRWSADVEVLDPDLVVFPFSSPDGSDFLHHGGSWLHPCQPEYDEWLRHDLHRAIDILGGHGAEVALVGAAYSTFFGAAEVRFERTDCVNAVISEVAAARREAVFVDLGRHVCPSRSTCHREIDGVELRSDGLHYEREGARHVAEWILAEVRRARR